MFETAELGQKVSKQDYRQREPELRQALLEAQGRLRNADFPVIVLFAGVDGAGKGETANLLTTWMDPRYIVTRAFDEPSQEEAERPAFWRFWRDLPPRSRIGIFLKAWYHDPLLHRVYGRADEAQFDRDLDEIVAFERTLTDDGALIVKYWMHLGKDAQRKRFKSLEKDPLQKWRVTKRDWKHWRMYDRFVPAAERLIQRTSTGNASWSIVEGYDERFRSLTVGTRLLAEIQRHLAVRERSRIAVGSTGDEDPNPSSPPVPFTDRSVTVLSTLDMDATLAKPEYRRLLKELQSRLNLLRRRGRDRKISTILVFEGWDAAGKGGAIRRVTSALDARYFQVIPIGAPTDEERGHHYLWRFWRHLPRAGRVTIFDRSWYGRVLVERVEGFARESEWRRAYAEINDFEDQLVEHGVVLLKFWIHITRDEQEARFRARQETPHKRWKLNDEDWRNRDRWEAYESAVNSMIERTSTKVAPWTLVAGNDKRSARIAVLRTLCERLSAALGDETSGIARAGK